MPLSEHEQRLLDQIERALYAEDPKFATSVRSTDLRTHMRRRLIRACVVLALGVVLLLVGVATKPIIGIFGFVVMVGALMLALSAWRRLGTGASGNPRSGNVLRSTTGKAQRPTTTPTKKTASKPTKKPRTRAAGSAKERLEERWKRRFDENGGGGL